MAADQFAPRQLQQTLGREPLARDQPFQSHRNCSMGGSHYKFFTLPAELQHQYGIGPLAVDKMVPRQF